MQRRAHGVPGRSAPDGGEKKVADESYAERIPKARKPQTRPERSAPAQEPQDPDVYLDIPVVKVDEIGLEVENLAASVSLQAEVLDLLKLKVGVDADLGRVDLVIKGVEAQALLKVRLDNVRDIITRVLKTIDDNPQILEHVARGVEDSLDQVSQGVGEATTQAGRGLGDTAAGAMEAIDDVVDDDDEDDEGRA